VKKYLIIGLGPTGVSILEFLQKNSEHELYAFDTRANLNMQELTIKFPKPKFYLGDIPLSVLDNIDELIVSPGVALNTPIIVAARKQGLPILGDIELFYQHAEAPIIGITGTNAKSTVTMLVTAMINASGIRAEMGGNIGTHALKLLDLPVPNYYVLELSSFQLELTEKLRCLTGAVLNVSPDHLDRHGDLNAYQLAKERLYLNCEHPVYFRGMQYLKAPTPLSYTFDKDEPLSRHDFGIRIHQGERYLAQGEQLLLPIDALGPGLVGEHNVINALSALALTAPLHLDLAPQLDVLRTFKGLPHRCVLVRTLDEVRWINDSKGTNIGATIAAIEGMAKNLSGRLLLILGGVGKNQDFNLLHPVVAKHVAHTFIFGVDKQTIAAALSGLSFELVDDLNTVIKRTYTYAEAGDLVLFSPACASYDMFKNYEERGDMFTERVMSL
jgi:UDP-N-acetylmuramoylalanine--D-glutamate ligase